MSVEKINSDGFFIKYHEYITKSIDDVSINNFNNLETDSKRVYYISSIPAVREFDLTSVVNKAKTGAIFPSIKNGDLARKLKSDGNMAVQRGDWDKAMDLYSDSYINMPDNGDGYKNAPNRVKMKTSDVFSGERKTGEDLAVVVANRSAALYHKGQMELCLADIERCLNLGYPKHLRYKVLERRAKCYLALKAHEKALAAFRETIIALDDATLPIEKRKKMQTDAQLMLEILRKGQDMAKAQNPKLVAASSPSRPTAPQPKLGSKPNPGYPAASSALEFVSNEEVGRYAVATRDLEVGDVIVVEQPHCSVLLGEYSSSHCQHCFARCSIPVACPKCSNVIYCSEQCMKKSTSTYHAFECAILPLLWQSGCSITCHMALRIISQNSCDYFKKQINTDNNTENIKSTSSDYRSVKTLLGHDDKRSKKDLFHRALVANFLTKLLEISGYFQNKVREDVPSLDELKSLTTDESVKDDALLIGGLILKNLQILQFNAHEVFELQCGKPKVGVNIQKHLGKSVFLGGGIYPTLALFNHSCDPGVVRYFSGTTVVVRAVKNIRAGSEISENYGPMFTTQARVRRRDALRRQYWFECRCRPCEAQWPLYDDMDETHMRFRCDSSAACEGVVLVPHDSSEFMLQCKLCSNHTNILKGLKALQDTDQLFKSGKLCMEEGKYGEALAKFKAVLKLYDGTLAPPYRAFYDCEQSLRRCMLAMGNYSIVA